MNKALRQAFPCTQLPEPGTSVLNNMVVCRAGMPGLARMCVVLVVLFWSACVQNRDSKVQMLDINELLNEAEAGKVSFGEADRETLTQAIFMDPEIKERIDSIDPNYLRDLDRSLYERDERDKLVVKLHDSYQNITSVLTRFDKNLIGIFRDKFEIIDPMKMIDGPVLIYNNKAFVTFYDSTFTLELKEPDTVIVTIVWLLTE